MVNVGPHILHANHAICEIHLRTVLTDGWLQVVLLLFSLKAGACWVNCHNLFDAAAGFGGYRESGFGRDGGKEVRRHRAAPPLAAITARYVVLLHIQ